MRRYPLQAASALALLMASATPARAYFHLMVIEEFYAGHAAVPDAHYVELRMTQCCQNVVSGHNILTFFPDGTPGPVFGTFDHNVANFQRNDKILMATQEAVDFFGLPADQVTTGRLPFPSGRICFSEEGIDCVAYGDFTGANGIYGSPAAALTRGLALQRVLFNDFNNNNSVDFQLAAPNPINNARRTGGLDNDFDLVSDISDCAPADPNLWFAPREIAGARAQIAAGGSILLDWNTLSEISGPSTFYDVVLGALGPLQAAGSYAGVASCAARDLAQTSFTDTGGALTGEARFYLVRGRNGCGVGTYGDSTLTPDPRDLLDDPASDPCP